MEDEYEGGRDTYITVREAVQLTGFHPHTLRKLDSQNKIKCVRTVSGQRRFHKKCLLHFVGSCHAEREVPFSTKQNFLYARVSSRKQLDDLERQSQFLRGCRQEYLSYQTLEDVGSGIHFKRKGLGTILDACLRKTIGEVVVAHRDRLSRVAFDLLEIIIQKAGGKVTVVDHSEHTTSEQELAEDLLSIVHIYSCRQMGRRSYQRKTTGTGSGDHEVHSNTIETNYQAEGSPR